jgi:hypothetical protein
MKVNTTQAPPTSRTGICTRLTSDGRLRDLAFFNRAVYSKLHGRDLVRLYVENAIPHGYAIQPASVQPQAGRLVRFEITEQSRDAVDTYKRDVA